MGHNNINSNNNNNSINNTITSVRLIRGTPALFGCLLACSALGSQLSAPAPKPKLEMKL